ncbi:NlpC/P60 family protein [Polaribacter sp.]|uniref:NlpC/P60 family protein n=1 Tax=Polaribacter sp. TaxID=1920175 RepID=UPI003F6BF5C8
MKKIFFLLVFSLVLTACSSSKKIASSVKKPKTKTARIIANALQYQGVDYKFGGTTKKGMDCSGLVYVVFGKENIQLPRISRNMAKKGKAIPLRKLKIGDLVFFKINRRSNQINHVGLVTSIKNSQIYFIHSTSSRGVIVSSLSEKYWKKNFVKATSIL